jgi:hypothetical protein
MNPHRALAIKALRQMAGDDLYRARVAFAGYTPEQMSEPHGESGQTRAAILAGYELREANVKAAIAWLEEA